MGNIFKPCPFCGSIRIKFEKRYCGQGNDSCYGKVTCMDCGASGPEYFIYYEEDSRKPIDSWNKRT